MIAIKLFLRHLEQSTLQSWILVILAVVAIFEADKMPQIKSAIEAKTKEGVEAVKKGAKKAEEKSEGEEE